MEKAYKFRLYPNREQKTLIQKTFGCCRFVYNQYLAKRIELYQQDKSTMNYNACSGDLKRLKQENDIICIEDLQVKNMVKNHKIAKSISDVSWSEFVKQLDYKAEWQHKQIVKIDKFYPSSQLCSVCGYKNVETKDLSIRGWECPVCSANHDRDINAAKNILNEGLSILNIA